MWPHETTTAGVRPRRKSEFALRLFAAAVAAFLLAGGLGFALVRLLGRPAPESLLPPAFLPSTLLLAAGSLCVHRAVRKVRRERQRAFRLLLQSALAAGIGFVGVQCYALWWLLQYREPVDIAAGVTAFLFVMVFLHAMHFSVALLFLTYVTLQARGGRYDHEYYWGAQICGWFWHALGIVWLVILGVFAIAA
jgi:cytochrome c oxidase subunit III